MGGGVHHYILGYIKWEKRKTHFSTSTKTVQEAKDLGLNISKIAENAIKEYIKRFEAPNPQTSNVKGGTGTVGSVVRGTGISRGFTGKNERLAQTY